MEQNTASLYDDDLTVGMEETEDFLDTGFVDLFEHSSNNGSPISRLKTIVLSIDWEINDEILTQFNDELLALKDIWAGDQIKLVYVQALQKISKYIYQLRADAHPNAIKLLLSFYYNLEKIVTGTELTEVETKEILREDIKKFEKLKHQIGVVSETSKPESGPKTGTTPPATVQSEPHPILFNLKASILGMDWEITERELTDLGQEVGRLEQEFAGRKPQMIFLQGIGALGGYIKLKKSDAHADAFKLLYSFYEGLEKIVVNPDLSKEEVKEILLPEVEKFEDFKTIVASTITPEAIAEKIVNEQPAAYGEDDPDSVSPAFSDVPAEVHGFQAEEEAATLGSAPDDVDNRLDTFFSGDEKSKKSSDSAGILPPDAIEKIDSFFGDDIVDDALSVSSISAEDALKGVDVETEADDESDEEALPTQGDGMLAPALADSAENEQYGFNPDISAEESLYAATDVDASINDIFAEDVADDVVTQAAALQGVDVESEADDDSDEQPLPKENEDIAPALAMEDIDSESAEEFQVESEGSEIDAQIKGFFGDDSEGDELTSIEPEAFAEGVSASALSEVIEDEVVDIPQSEKLPDGIEDRLDSFFAEPDEDTGALSDDQFGAEEDEVVFKAIDEEDSAFVTEDVATGLLDEELSELEGFEEVEVDTAEEELAAFDAEAAVEDESDAEEELAAFEAEAAVEDEADTEEELAAFEAEAAVEDEADAEEELAAFEAEAAVEDEADAEEELAAFEAEAAVEDEADAEEELAAFEAEAAVEDEADAEEELAAFEAEAAVEDETDAEKEGVAQLVSEFVAEDEAVSSFGSDSEEEDFFAAIDDRVEEPGEIQIELLSETDTLERELVTDHDEIDGVEVIAEQEGYTDADQTEVLSEQTDDEVQALSFAVNDELSELRAGVASLGIEINDNIIEGFLTEINRLRHRMMTKPLEKTFLQLLSTIVQHIGQYKYESSSEAHTLVLSVFDKLELSQKSETAQEQSQEILLAETCKVLLWQQKMLDRQAVKKGDELTFSDPIRVVESEQVEEGAERQIDAQYEALSEVDSEAHDLSKQDFTAVFEPVDDGQEFAAYEEIETTQEGLEHELGEAFIENESRPIDAESDQSADSASSEDKNQLKSGSEPDNLPESFKENQKSDIKGLTTILTDLVKREMKALRDLLKTELKALKDKLRDKDKK